MTTSTFASDRPLLGPVGLCLKTLHFMSIFLLGIILMPLVLILGRRSKRIINWWLRRVLCALHIRIDVDGEIPQSAMMVVANHCCWLDILVLGRLFDCAFVSKAEVGTWPVVKWFARAGDTVFLARGAGRTGETSNSIRQKIESGRSVLFFPEGTTTLSPFPKRFHARLFAAAIDGNHRVLPVGLRYCDDTTPPDMHHALAPWVDAPLWPHFREIFKLRELHAEIRICAPINPKGYDRRSLAGAAHAAITHRQSVAASRELRKRKAAA